MPDFLDDFDDLIAEELAEEDDDEYFDCGVYRDGDGRILGCSLAGTEDCDFDCPYRESVERSLRAQAAWADRKKKQKEKKDDKSKSTST